MQELSFLDILSLAYDIAIFCGLVYLRKLLTVVSFAKRLYLVTVAISHKLEVIFLAKIATLNLFATSSAFCTLITLIEYL